MSSRLKRVTFSNPLFLVFYALVFSIGAYFLIRSFAAPPATPSIYLTPSTQTLAANTNFTVEVRASSGAAAVNAVQANLSYPAALLDLVSIDTTSSAFSVEAEQIGENGTIRIARGHTTPLTGDVRIANITFRTKTSGGTATVNFTNGTVLVEAPSPGQHDSGKDILGSLSATFGGNYTIDTTPPTVSIAEPSANSTLTGGNTITIRANASDNTSISNVQILIDGTVRATLNSSPYTYNWNTSSVALGNHTIQARATDPYGNSASSQTITVTLADRTAPTVSISTPANNATVSGNITVRANASDNSGGTGVDKVEFLLDGTVIHTDTSSPYEFTWNSKSVSDGSHTLVARAHDRASPANVRTSSNITITVDNADRVAPSTPGNLTVTNRTKNSISLSWSASTDNVGVTGYRIQRGGVTIATVSANTLSYTSNNLSSGTNFSFTVTAIDDAGNVSTPASINTSTLKDIPADFNGDGNVNIFDLSMLLARWGSTTETAYDLNGNGRVDIFDLSMLLGNWTF